MLRVVCRRIRSLSSATIPRHPGETDRSRIVKVNYSGILYRVIDWVNGSSIVVPAQSLLDAFTDYEHVTAIVCARIHVKEHGIVIIESGPVIRFNIDGNYAFVETENSYYEVRIDA